MTGGRDVVATLALIAAILPIKTTFSSPLKNWKIRSQLRFERVSGVVLNRILVADSDASWRSHSCSDQFRNADQIVGDQIEQEVGRDAGDAAVLGFAHSPVLLAPTEDAFNHRAAGL